MTAHTRHVIDTARRCTAANDDAPYAADARHLWPAIAIGLVLTAPLCAGIVWLTVRVMAMAGVAMGAITQ